MPCWQQVYPVVIGARRREPASLVENRPILLEEVIQQGWWWSMDSVRRAGSWMSSQGSTRPSENASIAPPQGHVEILEVPQDGAEGAEIVNAEDEVKTT